MDYKRLDYEPLATLLLQRQQQNESIAAADGPEPSGVYTQVPTAPVARNPSLAEAGSAQCVPPSFLC